MDKKDFSDLEDQIRDTVKSAFNAIDFATLKKDIEGKADNTLNNVKTKLKNKSQEFNEKMENKRQNQYKNVVKTTKKDKDVSKMTKKYKNKTPMYICKRPVGSISGIIYTVLGSVLSGVSGILLILNSIWNSVSSGLFTPNYSILGILLVFFVSSMALTLRGINLSKRVNRFKQYVRFLDGQSYCSIQELAIAVRKKNKFITNDLRKMINLGMFKEAHIDEQKTCFMLSNEVYKDYLKSQEAFKERNEYELKRQEQSNEKINDPKKEELRCTIEMVNNYINQIKNANDTINGEEISTKLFRLQNIVSQIINYIDNNPKKLPEVNKFTTHYLPITLKLVNAYKELNDQPMQGDNIKSAKDEIEKSIDIINIAFEKLLDNLFEEMVLDISTDISVLQTLFTQEGLTKKDFEK